MRATALKSFVRFSCICLTIASLCELPAQSAYAQQRRGRGFGTGEMGAIKTRVVPHWFKNNTQFWYVNNLRDGAKEFILVDALAGKRDRAFDHEKLATALTKATDQEYKADHLPFDSIEFINDGKTLRFKVGNGEWKCDLASYEVTSATGTSEKTSSSSRSTEEPQPIAQDDAQSNSPEVKDDTFANPEDDAFDSPQAQEDAQAGRRGGRGGFGAGRGRGPATSPDKNWTATIRDNNIFITDKDGKETQLSEDGKDDFAYTRMAWSPDSANLVAYRMEPGDRKEVYRLLSSPAGKNGATGGGVGRAVLQTQPYALPGDKFDSYELNVFNVDSKKQLKPLKDERIDMSAGGGDPNPSFGGPQSTCHWTNEGKTFTIEKFDRGHQRMRLIEVNAETGDTRNLIDETSKTFIWTAHNESLGIARLINYLENENEIVYVSELDGWRHLYLVDAKAGTMKQITAGQWVVRGVNRIDQEARQIWFTASGVYPDQDPYFIHYGRVNFDGTGLIWLTSGNGNHTINFADEEGSFSPDDKYVIDSYSRVDMAPVTELRRVSDGQIVCALECGEVTASNWTAPEVFVAKGRDGVTDIWGIITRPRNLDTTKKYPIIEDIYAGPQGSFVPKSFTSRNTYADLNDLGFIVVKIDGMGTANRSKAFHDVCWKNIKDAGFEDRILWIKAAAKKYPYMDLEKVGIYGTSAGGQNAAAAVLFHPEFYKVAVANCGCHDNRMDKSSWNEQWMGYPVGKEYSECSNIDNAAKLKGRLQLVLGEVDSNVPVESTFRLVNALVQARKDFEFVIIPGANHGAASPITRRKLQDFFVRYLKGEEPPNHNSSDES
jgi:dipeptidyl aminopeptidase/acylaminoacyl peptidase